MWGLKTDEEMAEENFNNIDNKDAKM